MTPSREKAAEKLWSDICDESVPTRIALPLIIKALESAYREGFEKGKQEGAKEGALIAVNSIADAFKKTEIK